MQIIKIKENKISITMNKIFGLRQLKNNNLTNNLYLYLNRYYSDSENIKKHPFISQVNDLKTSKLNG